MILKHLSIRILKRIKRKRAGSNYSIFFKKRLNILLQSIGKYYKRTRFKETNKKVTSTNQLTNYKFTSREIGSISNILFSYIEV